MASLPVNNNVNVLAAIVNQTSGMPDNRKDEPGDSFDMVMSRVNSQTDNLKAAQTVRISAAANNAVNTQAIQAGVAASGSSAQNVQKGTVKSEENAADNNVKPADEKNVSGDGADNDDKTVSDDKSSDGNISDKRKEALNEAGEKLVEEVANQMEVTPEEVEEVMAVLGLSAVQLLDPDNMKQLLVTLSGNEDHLSIITDAELYGHLQNLLNEVTLTLEDLKTELGITDEEINTLIADMAVVNAKVDKNPEDITETLDSVENLTDLNGKTENLGPEGMKDYEVTVHQDGETVKVSVTVDDASGDKSMKEEVTAQTEHQEKAQSDTGSDAKGSSAQGKDEGNTQGSLIMQNPIEQPVTDKIMQEQPVAERYVDTQDIMNQIGEYIKLNLKADVQQLELQLHPASLGNVNIQLTAKDGMITAQFTTQNEAVKAAIESQLVQLRNQFDEQGLKVDAVEVAVADYRFNQGFSNNDENSGESAGSRKNRSRKINLNELDLEELPEDMEDSDRITAQMMAQRGSTVDYTA